MAAQSWAGRGAAREHQEGEEKMLLDACRHGWKAPVLVVPRHPRRFGRVAALGLIAPKAAPDASPADRSISATRWRDGFYFRRRGHCVIGGSFGTFGARISSRRSRWDAVATGPSMSTSRGDAPCARGRRRVSGEDAVPPFACDGIALRSKKLAQYVRPPGLTCEAHRGVTQRHLAACLDLLRKKQSGSDPDSKESVPVPV